MSVIYNGTLKNTRMSDVFAAADAGAGFGKLEIGTTGMGTVLATITLQKPSASVSGGVLTLLGVPLSVAAANAGTAAAARIRDSNNTDIVTGLTVGVGTGDVQIDNTNIALNQTVRVTGGTITHG